MNYYLIDLDLTNETSVKHYTKYNLTRTTIRKSEAALFTEKEANFIMENDPFINVEKVPAKQDRLIKRYTKKLLNKKHA